MNPVGGKGVSTQFFTPLRGVSTLVVEAALYLQKAFFSFLLFTPLRGVPDGLADFQEQGSKSGNGILKNSSGGNEEIFIKECQ